MLVITDKPEVWNTFRDPKEAPVHWMKEMPWKKIKLPKDPTLLLTEEKLSHAKHDNEIHTSTFY